MLHTGYLTRGGDSGRVVSPPRDFPLVDARLSLDITLHYLSAPIKPSNFRRRRETLSEEGKETFVRYPPGSALLDNKKWNGGGDWLRSFHLFHLLFFFLFSSLNPCSPTLFEQLPRKNRKSVRAGCQKIAGIVTTLI